MMLCLFRDRYPQGSLVSKLVKIDRGTYIVQVSITVDSIILATALAGAATVEAAEDAARERAIATLFLDSHPASSPQQTAANSGANAQSKKSPVESNLPSKSVADNIVDFSQKNPEAAHQEVRISPTAPTVVPKPAAPEPVIEPEPIIAAQDSEPASNTGNSGNLFAGTFPSETAPPTFPEDNSAEETVSYENLPNEVVTAEGGHRQFEHSLAPVGVLKDTPSDNAGSRKAPPLRREASPLGQGGEPVTTEPEIAPTEIADFDFTTVKQKTDIEIERLGWTRDDGREFLQSRYGKRSRLHLKDEELLEFLHYLEKQPTPIN